MGFVIDIATLHLQRPVQCFRAIECVTHPTDVTHIVLVTLIDVEEDIHQVITHIYHAVSIDISIAVTEFVVLLNDTILVLFKLLCHEFLGFEETLETLLIGLFQKTT